jgi:hypothetical protein
MLYYTGTLRRHHVNSRAVRSIGYDAQDWVLQIEFTSGAVYNYFRVPPAEHAKLMGAKSIGTHVEREIKPYYESEADEEQE